MKNGNNEKKNGVERIFREKYNTIRLATRRMYFLLCWLVTDNQWVGKLYEKKTLQPQLEMLLFVTVKVEIAASEHTTDLMNWCEV